MNSLNRKKLPDNLTWVIAAVINFGLLFLLEWKAGRATGAMLMYPLDDPFIHMQIARSLAESGTWGINAGEFGSASSSILYTLLLTLFFKIFSVKAWIPFLINCLAGLGLLYATDRWLARKSMAAFPRLLVLLGVILLMPLPVMILSGMEHVVQTLICFLFLTRFSDWWEAAGQERKSAPPLVVFLLALLAVAVRFEGIFLVIAAGLFLFLHKRWTTALLLGIVAVLPVIVFGLVSLSKGSFFFPNSVVLKSTTGGTGLKQLISLISGILIEKLTIVKGQSGSPAVPPPGISLLAAQRLLILLPVMYLLFRKFHPKKYSCATFGFLLLGTTILHLCFASTGWFYRYEAYLIFCAIILFSLFIKDTLPLIRKDFTTGMIGKTVTFVLLFAIFFPFVLRIAAAYSKAPRACANIYEQQYQMAAFVKKNQDLVKTVAVNDIGAVSFYNNARVVDLWGLANIDIAKSRLGRYDTPGFTDSLVRAKQVDLLMIYDSWFSPELTGKWHKVATWTVQDNVILGGDTVSFYTLSGTEKSRMEQRLREFENQLPDGVSCRYNEDAEADSEKPKENER